MSNNENIYDRCPQCGNDNSSFSAFSEVFVTTRTRTLPSGKTVNKKIFTAECKNCGFRTGEEIVKG